MTLYCSLIFAFLMPIKLLYAETGIHSSIPTILIPPGLAACFVNKAEGRGKYLDNQEYPVYNALDNDLTTSWVANNQVALFEFLPFRLNTIYIAPGHTKSNKTYKQNKRPRVIRYRLWKHSEDMNNPQPTTDWIEVELSSPEVLPESEHLFAEIPVAITSGYIRAIEFKVVKGIPEATAYDDICISEIRFYGVPSGYQPGYSIIAESDYWVWPNATLSGDDLEGNRLSYYFDSIDTTFSRFAHQWTGGATSIFQGESRVIKSGYHLKGKVTTSDSTSVEEEEDFDRVIQVRLINPFIAIIDGHLFVRRQKLWNGVN